MNQQLKTFLIILAAIFIAGGSLAYGALTAPAPQKQAPTIAPAPQVKKSSLNDQLKLELPTITGALTAAYPKITTDYSLTKSQLFGDGEWFGTLLLYKGGDTANRDTLRVLMQKKNGMWYLRTTPPEMLLSTKKYPDVPKDILKTINQPISLP